MQLSRRLAHFVRRPVEPRRRSCSCRRLARLGGTQGLAATRADGAGAGKHPSRRLTALLCTFLALCSGVGGDEDDEDADLDALVV